jgi:uncharacterized protein YaaR (DUF327 family)
VRIESEKSWAKDGERQRVQKSDETFAHLIHAHQTHATTVQSLIALGDELTRSLSLAKLIAYKERLRTFLALSIKNTIDVQHKAHDDQHGRRRHQALLAKIDAHMQQLTDEAMKTEEGRVHLLAAIGYIRGLLIDVQF